MAARPEQIEADCARLRELFAITGKPAPEVAVLTRLPLADPTRAADLARAFRAAGATSLVHGSRYADAAEFARDAEALAIATRALRLG